MYDIIEKYGLPRKYVSCPGCGRVYGHHNTKVDINSEECSSCVKERGAEAEAEFVDAEKFIREYT